MWRMAILAVVAVGLFGAVGCGGGSSTSSNTPSLALTQVDCKISTALPDAGCHGKAKNLTSEAMTGLVAVVVWVDGQGNTMATAKQPIIGTVNPGDEISWNVDSSYDKSYKDYRIEFQDVNGNTIPSVDQRPQP